MKNKFELYIHIPFCVKKCNYCDFLSGPYDVDVQQKYVSALCSELKWQSFRVHGRVTSIYIGGGTPSWIKPELTGQIMDCVKKYYDIEEPAEISMEANPGTVNADAANYYRSVGINRLSIGLQSANLDELQLLGRIHDFRRFLRTFEIARDAGFDNINVDIMTGLPGQNPDKLMYTLKNVFALKPEHISAYSLIIEEGTPFYEKYKFDVFLQQQGKQTQYLPTEDETYELMKLAQTECESHGYHRYEISNYARKGRECVHNIGYWTRVPYLGVGIGAASLLTPYMLSEEEEAEDDSEIGLRGLEWRVTNEKDIYDYINDAELLTAYDPNAEFIDVPIYDQVNRVSRKDAIEEFMFLGLRQTAGVSSEDFYHAFGCSIEGIYEKVFEELEQEELLERKDGRIYLTDKGLDLSTYAMSKFLID